MKRILASAALCAALSTVAYADNNEIFVTQSGNNNQIGNAAHPATQTGIYNDMTFTQSGSDNVIGASSNPARLQGAIQDGDDHVMDVTQPGHRNQAIRLEQDGGNHSDMFIRQSGNDHKLGFIRQPGDKQLADNNSGNARQVGRDNVLMARQSGNANDFLILSGDFGVNGRPGACTSCDVTLIQSGNSNYSNVWQQGNNQMASITQSGNNNTAYTKQSPN